MNNVINDRIDCNIITGNGDFALLLPKRLLLAVRCLACCFKYGEIYDSTSVFYLT